MCNLVENENVITDFFGYLPNFHDDEIISVYMERSRPYIDLVIRVLQNKPCEIKLRFDQIIDMQLSGFNNQNVILNLSFTKIKDEIRSEISSSFGLEGYIVSSKVTVISLRSLNQ